MAPRSTFPIDPKLQKFLDDLLSEEALHKPSDSKKESEIRMELPPWFDERKFKLGQKFWWDNLFAMSVTTLIGLMAVIVVPTILAVLVGSKRSANPLTAYRRYVSTLYHILSWNEHDLKPGSVSWKSLEAVRMRHLRAGKDAKLKIGLVVSQRDVAITQWGFIGFTLLKPEMFGVQAFDKESWEGYVHFWRTIGYMLGLEDRYNICQETAHETRQVCQYLLDHVIRPSFAYPPEHFVHMAAAILDGLWALNPNVNIKSVLYFSYYAADVPGYCLTETERFDFRGKLIEMTKDKEDKRVNVMDLIGETAIKEIQYYPKYVHPDEFLTLETQPEYNKLNGYEKYRLNFVAFSLRWLYNTRIGRWLMNGQMYMTYWLIRNFPFLAIPRFGYKKSYVDMMEESMAVEVKMRKNEEFLDRLDNMPWYIKLWPFGTNYLYE